MRGPERIARMVLVVGLVLATGIPLLWTLTTPPDEMGTLPSVQALPLPRTATANVARPAGTLPMADRRAAERGSGIDAPGDPRPSTRSARIGDVDTTAGAVPERLRIPSIDVDARVVAVGVADDGEMEVPDDVRDIGWYRHGPTLGARGATVLAGHVDSREQGRGAFFDLRRLDVGARVAVTDSAGEVRRFEVVARRRYHKAKLPADELFARDGPPQLVLITCGGDFDRDARSYRSNVVIYAQPYVR